MKVVKHLTGFLLSILFVVAITSTSFAYNDLLTPSFINNYRYYCFGSFVTLKNGKYHYSSERVGIVTYLITGTYSDQPVASVVLWENGGGSGTFNQLIVLYQKGNKVYQMKPIDLGDRINFQSIGFSPSREGGKFIVAYYTRGPNDPMCCPTKYTTKTINVNIK